MNNRTKANRTGRMTAAGFAAILFLAALFLLIFMLNRSAASENSRQTVTVAYHTGTYLESSTTAAAPETWQTPVLKQGTDGGWYAWVGDQQASDFSGIVGNAYGNWYVLNGQVDFGFTGQAEYNGNIYDIESGQVIGWTEA